MAAVTLLNLENFHAQASEKTFSCRSAGNETLGYLRAFPAALTAEPART